jgi:hypothetical protein
VNHARPDAPAELTLLVGLPSLDFLQNILWQKALSSLG